VGGWVGWVEGGGGMRKGGYIVHSFVRGGVILLFRVVNTTARLWRWQGEHGTIGGLILG
jgi:hypothetical protein